MLLQSSECHRAPLLCIVFDGVADHKIRKCWFKHSTKLVHHIANGRWNFVIISRGHVIQMVAQFNYFIEDSWKFCEVRIWCRQSRWGCCVIIVSVRACARIAMIILGTKIAAWECLGPVTVPVVSVWCTGTGTVHIAIFKTPPSRTVGVRKAEHRRYWPVRNFYHPLAFTVQ